MESHVPAPTLIANYTQVLDDMSYSAESHWNTASYVCLLTGLLLIILLGLIGNSAILYIFISVKSMHSPTNMFIVSIAISDLGVTLFGTPFAFASTIAQRWLFGYPLCRMYGFVVLCLGLVSLLSHGAIAFDRYFVIAKMNLGIKRNYKMAAVAILATWLWAFLWAFFPLVGWSGYTYEGLGTWCSVIWQSETGDRRITAYVLCLFFFTYCLTLVCMTFCYTSIYMAVRDISRRMNGYTNEEKKRFRSDRKVLRVMMMIGVTFFAAWTPYGLVSLWATFGDVSQIPMALITSCSMCGKASTAINPMVYTATNRAFRSHVKKLLVRLLGMSSSDSKGTEMLNLETRKEVKDGKPGRGGQSNMNQFSRTSRLYSSRKGKSSNMTT